MLYIPNTNAIYHSLVFAHYNYDSFMFSAESADKDFGIHRQFRYGSSLDDRMVLFHSLRGYDYLNSNSKRYHPLLKLPG